MSLQLILMRHAKSSWSDAGLSDHERPLNKRGQQSSIALGDWLVQRGWLPDMVLCSTSRRTRETLDGLQLRVPVRFEPALYQATAETMFSVLKTLGTQSVLVLGHNPGIAEFAGCALRTAPSHPRFADYPTGATLVARFPVEDWRVLEFGSGEALDFVIPRDLVG